MSIVTDYVAVFFDMWCHGMILMHKAEVTSFTASMMTHFEWQSDMWLDNWHLLGWLGVTSESSSVADDKHRWKMVLPREISHISARGFFCFDHKFYNEILSLKSHALFYDAVNTWIISRWYINRLIPSQNTQFWKAIKQSICTHYKLSTYISNDTNYHLLWQFYLQKKKNAFNILQVVEQSLF